jgi:transposase
MAKRKEIQDAIRMNMSPAQVDLISLLLGSVDILNSEIASIDKQIQDLISKRQDDLKIAMSIPGMGFTTASAILAEIGILRILGPEINWRLIAD